MSRTRDAGLTLIEVLVSVSIFAVIGLASLTLLQSLARTEARLSDQRLGLAAADRAFTVIARTLANAEAAALEGDTLLVSAQGQDIEFAVADGILTRHAAGLSQPLLSLQSAQWALIAAPRGRLIALELTLDHGLSGRRLFYVEVPA